MRPAARPRRPQDADLVVVNTCSVTSSADQGARQIVRKIARENPHARIVVTGCYATRRPDEVAALPGVVQIVPNDRKDSCRCLRAERRCGLTTAERFGDGDGACGAEIAPGLAGRTAFTLRVQTGCDQTCSYCIIPSTRGAGRSRPLHDVLSEIDRVSDAGYREVAITGVHLGSYGRDLGGRVVASRPCCRRSSGTRSGMRFRISSLEPMDCSDEIVDLVAASTCFAPHFHLPLQHASDGMLVAMRRPYTLAYYRRLVDRIRERDSARVDRHRHHRRVSWRNRRRLRSARGVPARVADYARARVSVFGSARAPRRRELPEKVHGSIVRERASAVRAHRARAESSGSIDAQDGSVRPGLTIEDGSLVVTDNYLKVRIPPGCREMSG